MCVSVCLSVSTLEAVKGQRSRGQGHEVKVTEANLSGMITVRFWGAGGVSTLGRFHIAYEMHNLLARHI